MLLDDDGNDVSSMVSDVVVVALTENADMSSKQSCILIPGCIILLLLSLELREEIFFVIQKPFQIRSDVDGLEEKCEEKCLQMVLCTNSPPKPRQRFYYPSLYV